MDEFPEQLCGASLIGGETCPRLAGMMTDHLGEGWCWQHGGLGKPSQDIFRNALETHGLGGIMDLAETLSHDEVEYIQHVSSAALIAIRAKIVAQLMDVDRSPKEQADLSLALRRVEASIAALRDGKPLGLTDPGAIERSEKADAERERIEALRAKFGG